MSFINKSAGTGFVYNQNITFVAQDTYVQATGFTDQIIGGELGTMTAPNIGFTVTNDGIITNQDCLCTVSSGIIYFKPGGGLLTDYEFGVSIDGLVTGPPARITASQFQYGNAFGAAPLPLSAGQKLGLRIRNIENTDAIDVLFAYINIIRR